MQTPLRFRRATATLAVLAVLAWAGNALLAQTFTHNTTTLSAAQAITDTTLTLTSASAASGSTFGAVQVGQLILVDQEVEAVTAVASTTITVQRQNARRTAHASGTPVYIAAANAFQQADPPAGSCTTANVPKFWINLQNGGVFTCGANSVWSRGNAPWFSGTQSGNGATVTLTAAQSGTVQLFDRAAGTVYTLPAPFPGLYYDFLVNTTVTSNAHKVISDGASTFLIGSLVNIDTDTSNAVAAWTADGSTIRSISMNGTTTGGLKGTWFRFTAVSSTIWMVTGIDQGSGTVATPFATS